ncbi:MAG: alpha/beta hydrolase [Rubritepida sp.]|nr:alpha/beta hydrolase [Rubritepida sp.]
MVAAAAVALGSLGVANLLAARRAQRRHPPAGRFLEIDGVRLHYTDEGEGRPIALLHGNGGTVEDFALSGLPSALIPRYRVLAFDRPGFGHSTRPHDRRWTAAAQAVLLRRALAILHIERPVVVGHSWGALVAISLALDFPDDVAALVLISGYYTPERRADVALVSATTLPVLGRILNHTLVPVLARLFRSRLLRRIFAPGDVPPTFAEEFPFPLALRPSQLEASAMDTARMNEAAAAVQRRSGDFTVPAILVAGSEDAMVDAETHSLALHRALPGSVMRCIAGAGHMVHHTAPAETLAAIRMALAAGPGTHG